MVQRTLYYKGTSKETTKTVGSDELTFNTIKVSGAADFTKPTAYFNAPRSGAHLTNNTPTIRLKVSDNIGVASVFISVNSTVHFAPATPSGAVWQSNVTLPSGFNILRSY